MNENLNQKDILTTDAGIPVSDNQNSLTAGSRGLLLMQVRLPHWQ